MAKGLSAAKAKKILEDGNVRGKALTEKQKKFFGAVAGGATPLKKLNGGWLDKFQEGGVQPNYNDSNVSLPPGFKGYGYDKGGRAYNGAWDGPVTRMGGTIPGATGMMYARTSGLEPLEPNKAQDGSIVFDKEDITPQRIEQGRQRVLDYYSSPGYLKLLKNSYDNPEQEQLERINNVKSTKVLDTGYIDAYNPETHSVRFSPNYYKDLTEHEFLHAGTKGPERISENEKFIISMNVKDPDRQAAFASGQDPYIEIPEEYQARLGVARMLMQHNNMFDYNKETFTQEHLDKIKKDMEKNPKRWNIKGFQDVMKSRESDDALIEIMNTVAQNTQNTQNSYLAKYGKVIEDDRGQWAYPGEITKINSNNITMKGVDYPVLGISDTGDTKMMQPGKDYKFKGNSVTEFPIAQYGRTLSKKEQDSLTLYKAYQFQKQNSKKAYQQWLNDVGKMYPGGPEELKKAREKNIGEYGQPLNIPPIDDGYYKNEDDRYDPPYEQDKVIIEEYKRLINNDPDFRIGIHNSPDLWHKDIKPIGNYFDGSSSPIYKKPSFVKPKVRKKERSKQQSITTLKSNDIIQPELSVNLSDIYVPAIDYWNVTKEVNQNFGGHKRSFKVFDENELQKLKERQAVDERSKTGKDNKLIIKPVYSKTRKTKLSAKDGKSLVELNQLTNFTNYNTPQPGGWLDKYN